MSAVKTNKQLSTKRKKPLRGYARSFGLRRFSFVGMGLSICAFGLWAYLHSAALISQGLSMLDVTLVHMGFVLEDVIVEGRIRTDKAQILKTANLSRGKSLFSFDINAIKTTLEQVPWVNAVSVERRFPDTLFIRISEREPVAIWRNKRQTFLVDRDGQLIEAEDTHKYGGLLHISGVKAPQHVGSLISILEKFPEVKSRVTTAIHLRSTRWDIRLDGRVDIKLPEKGAAQALAYLLDLEKHHRLMEGDILNIDLRIPNQMVLRLTPEAAAKQNKTGKDA